MNALVAALIALFHRLLALLPAPISSRIYALLFTLNLGLQIPVSAPLHVSKTTLLSLPTNVFSARPPPATARTRTVIVVHGLATSAHDDHRITNLAHAIAAADPRNLVLVPYVPPLAECRLADDPVALIARLIDAVAADTALCPSRRLSIASPCISAGFSLVAAAEANTVHSALCIGTHAVVHNTLLHVLDRKGKDDSRYGINAVLSSFWDPPCEPLSRMLAAYCSDDHHRGIGKPANQLAPLLQQYPEQAKIYRRLHDDDDFLSRSLNHVYKTHESTFAGMSPIAFLDKLPCHNVALIHAQTDDIVPPSESLILKNALEKRGDVNVSCIVTSLLNHGDQQSVGLANIPEIFNMINAFSVFFLPDTHVPPQTDKTS